MLRRVSVRRNVIEMQLGLKVSLALQMLAGAFIGLAPTSSRVAVIGYQKGRLTKHCHRKRAIRWRYRMSSNNAGISSDRRFNVH